MTGVRLDRFFALTAIALLLCAGGTAFAGSSGDQDTSAATETTSSVSDQPAAASDPAMEAAPAPAADAIPGAPAPAGPPDPAAPPATAAEQPGEPKVPSAAETPPAAPKPAAASGGDEVPTPTASAPAVGTAATTVADGNTAISEKLRDLATGKFDRMLGGKKESAAIEAYYASRDYAPLWLTDGKPNARGQAAIAYLGHVDADGLEPSDYPTPNFASLSDPAALAEAELRLSLSAIAYAHHAEVGRVHWSRVSGDISYEPKIPAPADVLAKVASASDVGGG